MQCICNTCREQGTAWPDTHQYLQTAWLTYIFYSYLLLFPTSEGNVFIYFSYIWQTPAPRRATIVRSFRNPLKKTETYEVTNAQIVADCDPLISLISISSENEQSFLEWWSWNRAGCSTESDPTLEDRSHVSQPPSTLFLHRTFDFKAENKSLTSG